MIEAHPDRIEKVCAGGEHRPHPEPQPEQRVGSASTDAIAADGLQPELELP